MSIREPGVHGGQARFGAVTNQHKHESQLDHPMVQLAGDGHQVRPIEAGERRRAPVNCRGVGEDGAEEGQSEAEAAQNHIFPCGLEGGIAVVEGDQQDGGQGGGFQGKPHHAEVVGKHDEKHAGREEGREHEEFLHPAGRYDAGSQVAPEIPAGVEGGSERDYRDQQHHPGAQGIRAKELPAFGNDVGLAREHVPQQLHAQCDGDAKGSHVCDLHHAA